MRIACRHGKAALLSLSLVIAFIGANAVRADAQQPTPLLLIQTVPKLPRVTFSLDGNPFLTDKHGLALTSVAPGEPHLLRIVTPQRRAPGIKKVFAGWSDGPEALEREIQVDTSTVLQAGFETSSRIQWSFVDSEGAPLKSAGTGSVTLVDDRGDQSLFSGRGPHYIPSIRVMATDGRFSQEKISYQIVEAVVNGIVVTAQVPETIDLGESRRWTITPALQAEAQPSNSESSPTPEGPEPAAYLIGSVVAIGLSVLILAGVSSVRQRTTQERRAPPSTDAGTTEHAMARTESELTPAAAALSPGDAGSSPNEALPGSDFVQIVTGYPIDGEAVMEEWRVWLDQVGTKLPGWLGVTSGISVDGKFIALLRFARVNDGIFSAAGRELEQWSTTFSEYFHQRPEVLASSQVDARMTGRSEDVTCVQFIRARTKEIAEVREINAKLAPIVSENCPEIIGHITAWHSGGEFTEAVYFVSKDSEPAGYAALDQLEQLNGKWMSLLDRIEFISIGPC